MKEEHMKYVGKKHKLLCENIFSETEFEILENCGEWLYALIDGTLQPYTEAQNEFIRFHKNMNLVPQNEYQRVWKKYQMRINYEKKNPYFSGRRIAVNDLPIGVLGINSMSHEPRF